MSTKTFAAYYSSYTKSRIDILVAGMLYQLSANRLLVLGRARCQDNEPKILARCLFARLLKVDTVICWDPRAHDEENPDHYTLARAVEAACWMASRAHDYPDQFVAGLPTKTVQEKYYYARRVPSARARSCLPAARNLTEQLVSHSSLVGN